MKKKINKFLFMVLIPVVVCMTAGILAFSGISDAYTSVRALSGNGGIIYVGSGSKLNMTNGSLYGGTATNGGAVYVSANGTFNLSGGLIFANTASTNGNNIYNAGTFNMTGGKVGKQVLARVDENGNKSETGNYVYFGSYPQTLKASSVTIDASSVDGNGYYLGSDGERYAKVTAKKDCYGNSSKYTFSNGSSISAGTTYYFKVEPIKWKILSSSNGKLTLYAEDIIEQSRWDSSVILNYKTSSIRSFINGDFLNGAFSSEEQAMIQTTTVDNGTSTVPSAGASCVCENTTDKVFLLSYKDVINGGTYGFTNSSRMKQATDFAKANGLYVSVSSVTSENQTMYWTRSPYDNSTYNYATMFSTGEVMGGGIEANLGVAPAIVVSNSETDNGYGIYNTGTMNLYGGHVYDMIYSSTSFNTKMAATLHEEISITDSATITVQDYAGTTPTYKIKLTNSRSSGTIVTFLGDKTTSPDISKFTVTGYNSDCDIVIRKNSNGYFELALTTMELPSDWKTQVASTTYMTTTVTPANLTSIKFVASVPSGYTKIGTLSTGLPVYKGTTATEIAFVAKSIFAPVNSSNLFKDLRKLTTIDFAVFKTTNVTDMHYMFYYCSSLTSLDVSGFNTTKVTNMDSMFAYCNNLTSLNVSSFNTSNVTNMVCMFYYCSSLTNLNVSSFNTSKVTNMSSMFTNCSSLTSLNVSSFNTSNVTNMGCMFQFCSALTILDLSNFSTTKVTDMSSMFYGCSSLTNLNVSSFNTSKVTTMLQMFTNCSSLKSLNVSNFNTTNVTSMVRMFYNCSSLTSLNVSSFSTTNVTSMSTMFTKCSSLTSLNVSSFNTTKVTKMGSMFKDCNLLVSLDLSSFDMTKVISSSDMLNFGTSAALKYIKTPYKNSTAIAITTGSTLYNVSTEEVATGVLAKSTSSQTLSVRFTLNLDANGGSCSVSSLVAYYYCSLTNVGKSLPTATQSGYTFSGWYTEKTGGTRIYDSTTLTYTTTTTLYAHWTENTPTPDPDPPTPPDPGPDPDPGPGPSEDSDIENAEYIIFTTTKPSGLHLNSDYTYDSRTFFNSDCSTPDVYTNESGTQVAFVANPGNLVAPTDCTGMFKQMGALKWVIFRNYDTFNSTDFSEMFYGCAALERVDCLSIQTPNVTSMRAMFQECNSLKEIVYANFDCISLTDASYMFAGCSLLGTGGSIGRNRFNETIPVVPELKYTYNLDNAEKMFYGASFGEYFCMPYFTTENLSNASGMFTNFSVDVLDLSQFICRYYSAADLFFESSEFNFKAIYTPRFADISFLPTDTWLLGDGSDSDLFKAIGMEDSVAPFSLCFVKEEYKDQYRKGTFRVDINEWGFDELSVIIRKFCEAGIYFSGNYGSFTFTTYLPLNDVYYVLPIPYKDDFDNGNDGEMRFAGWVVSGAKTKEELGFEDFIGYWELGSPQNSYCDGTYPIEAIGWADDTVTNLLLSYNGDMSSPNTPYYNWYENSRNLYSRVRYLPTCRNESGNIFYGWSESSQGAIISYYNNIVSYGGGSSGTVWWSDGLTAEFRDLSMYTGDNDYWTLPTSSSFTSNTEKASEKDLESMMNLYETNKQEILIPEDKKVTITDLKLKKVS